MSNWRGFIERKKDVCAGKPVIKGTRITVQFVLEKFANGWTFEDILDQYPSLTKEQVTAAIRTKSHG